jgi:hypothetical protein
VALVRIFGLWCRLEDPCKIPFSIGLTLSTWNTSTTAGERCAGGRVDRDSTGYGADQEEDCDGGVLHPRAMLFARACVVPTALLTECVSNVHVSVSSQIKSAKTIKERCEAVKKQSAAMADRLHAMHAANAPVVRVVSEP